MPDTQLIAVILLLVAAVLFGYFYFKRAQARSTSVDDTMPAAATAPTPARTDYSRSADGPIDDVARRDGVDDSMPASAPAPTQARTDYPRSADDAPVDDVARRYEANEDDSMPSSR